MMNLVELQRRLIGAARSDQPSDRVPLAFEKRIMALIAASPILDKWALWARTLWCAAAPCVAIMLLFAFWTLSQPATTPSPSAADLSLQFDKTVLAAVEQDGDSSW